jgi:hypothetical protein
MIRSFMAPDLCLRPVASLSTNRGKLILPKPTERRTSPRPTSFIVEGEKRDKYRHGEPMPANKPIRHRPALEIPGGSLPHPMCTVNHVALIRPIRLTRHVQEAL